MAKRARPEKSGKRKARGASAERTPAVETQLRRLRAARAARAAEIETQRDARLAQLGATERAAVLAAERDVHPAASDAEPEAMKAQLSAETP